MSSETIYLQHHPAGHRNRHTPHLCAECSGPLTTAGRCTRCAHRTPAWPTLAFPDRRTRLERMERVVGR